MSFADYMKEFGEVVGDKDDNKCCGEEGARHSHTVTKTRKGKLIKYCKQCQKECLFKKDRVEQEQQTRYYLDDDTCCGEPGARHSHRTVQLSGSSEITKICKVCQKYCPILTKTKLKEKEKPKIKCVIVGDGQTGKTSLCTQVISGLTGGNNAISNTGNVTLSCSSKSKKINKKKKKTRPLNAFTFLEDSVNKEGYLKPPNV